jgi:hypothetical protein
LPPPPTPGCAVGAFGVARAPLARAHELRKTLGPRASAVKQSDEQTVLALCAVLRAAADAGWEGRSFAEWGVIAAPRHLGRLRVASALDRFGRQGPRSVSPLIIPNCSLHSTAGTLSMALGAHGPNFGVGGGHGGVAEALLAGLALAGEGGVPGVWVTVSEWDPEPVPDASGETTTPAEGYAAALALVPGAAAGALWLRLNRGAAPAGGVRELVEALAGGTRTWCCAVDGVGALELVGGEGALRRAG